MQSKSSETGSLDDKFNKFKPDPFVLDLPSLPDDDDLWQPNELTPSVIAHKNDLKEVECVIKNKSEGNAGL